MDISKISNEAQEMFPIKNWVGWKVGWLTGWYNPMERLGDLINPADLGRLVSIQGEYMQAQGKLVQDLGGKLSQFSKKSLPG
jgi:hypothetical protein